MATIARVLMASTDAERQCAEDQLTVNLWARNLLAGNASVVVYVGPDGKERGYRRGDWDAATAKSDVARLLAVALAQGARVIRGDVLYTPRDNPRAYKPAK